MICFAFSSPEHDSSPRFGDTRRSRGVTRGVDRGVVSGWVSSIVRCLLGLGLWIAVQAGSSEALAQEATRFDVRLPPEVSDQPRGRLFVFLSRAGAGDVRLEPDWFSPEPFFGKDLEGWAAGESQAIDDSADGFPHPVSELPAGKYRGAAIYDVDFYYPSPKDGVGNRYSPTVEFEVKEGKPAVVELVLEREVVARPWPDSPFVVPIERRSELLSAFHQREVIDRAAVVLPATYFEDPQRRYPVVYVISGFGGHLPDMAQRSASGGPPAAEGEVEFIRVLLSGECKWGHHVYADSATNGPRGQALVQELIPLIDEQFRTVADPRARYVTGHSSGGWSSLWLQVAYPHDFGGVWSTSPDPVDFRDYQQTDLYADPAESVYFEADGQRKPLARRGTTPVVWYPDFGRMDDVLKRGGQLRSFEAVFSPRGADGEPLKMWDRTTGKVDLKVVEAWKEYDISWRLRSHWQELREPLAGKLHVVMGDLDTFYLEGATILLKEALQELGSDAQIEIVPGADHGSVLTPQLRARQRREMSEVYRRHFGS